MNPAKVRLAIAVVLFSGWLGWLAYLALTAGTRPGPPGVRKPPVVLSHPQFLESTFDVVALVDEADGQPMPQVTIRKVLWPEQEARRVGQVITVTNLGASRGWAGPGEYLLPLVTADHKTCQVASIPRYPGLDAREQVPHIYPYNAETEFQYNQVKKP